MKILAYIFGGVIVLALAALIFVFSAPGNSIIASYAQNLAKQKANIELKFDKFKLGFNSLELLLKINDEISLGVNGELSIFSQKLDLNYDINAAALNSANLKLTEPISLKGQIKGKFSNFDANGAGMGFGSGINFLAHVKDYKPLSLKLNAQKLKLAEILAALNKPAYASALIDISADVNEKDSAPFGTAKLEIYDGILNQAPLKQDFNINVPKDFKFSAISNADIQGFLINLKSLILTPIATAKADKAAFDITKNELFSDFEIDAPDLAKFESILNQKLSGALKATGDIKISQNKIIDLNALISGLGGKIAANLKDGSLNANIDNIKLGEALKLALLPAYANANINGKAVIENLDDIKNIKGEIKLSTAKGALNAKELKKAGLNLAKDIDFSLNANANMQSSIANFTAALNSELINLSDLKGEYNIAKGALNADFKLSANDLAKFEALLGQKLSGAVNLAGNVKALNNKLSELNLNGKALGGDISALLKGENLRANLKNATLKDAFLLAGLDPMANATLNLEALISSFDIKNLNGDIKLELTNGQIYEKALSKILDKEFPAGVKFSANSNVNLKDSIADFNAILNSNLLNLKNANGKFNINTQNLDAKINANIPELGALKFITSHELSGALEVSADIIKSANNLKMQANSDIFGGKMTAVLENNVLNANLNNFNLKDLSKTLKIDHVYDGAADAKVKYDLASQKGDFNAIIKEGRLVANGFTNAVKNFLGRDLTSEVYKNATLDGVINKSLINFNAKMSAPKSDLNVTNGAFNITSKAINIPVDFRLEKTDIKVKITGTSEKPNYSISSDYLKGKVEKEINRFLDKKLGADSNATNKNPTKDLVKDLIKGLF